MEETLYIEGPSMEVGLRSAMSPIAAESAPHKRVICPVTYIHQETALNIFGFGSSLNK
jgi:hypothetical protein